MYFLYDRRTDFFTLFCSIKLTLVTPLSIQLKTEIGRNHCIISVWAMDVKLLSSRSHYFSVQLHRPEPQVHFLFGKLASVKTHNTITKITMTGIMFG